MKGASERPRRASFFKVLAAKRAQGGRRDRLRLESNFQAPLFSRSEMCYNINDFHILGLN